MVVGQRLVYVNLNRDFPKNVSVLKFITSAESVYNDEIENMVIQFPGDPD